MFDDDGKMLITAHVRCPCPADFTQGIVAARLRPGITVKVRQQTVALSAMQMNGTAKSRLRQHAFHLGAGPILAPLVQKFQLPIAQQFQAGQIDRSAIVTGIVDVIGTRSHLGDFAFRSTLEFAIFEDGEVDAADGQVGVVDADLAFDRSWVIGIRQMPCLTALHHVDVFGVDRSNRRSGPAELVACLPFSPQMFACPTS